MCENGGRTVYIELMWGRGFDTSGQKWELDRQVYVLILFVLWCGNDESEKALLINYRCPGFECSAHVVWDGCVLYWTLVQT